MGLTNFPKGVSSFGVPVTPPRQFKKVLWVGNASGLPAGDGSSPDYPLSSLFGTGGALAKAHPTLGTLIRVLDGHAESISSADHASATGSNANIVIRGEGDYSSRATFTWTAATATWLFDTAGIQLENLNLLMAGSLSSTTALTVAAPITVSKAGCAFRDCYINMGVDADQLVTDGITTTAAGDHLMLERNTIVGDTAAEVTSMIKLVGCDHLLMRENYIAGATSAAGAGVVLFATTASLNIRSERNTIINRKALSTCAVTGLAAVSGVSREDHFAYLDTASLTPWLTSTGIMTFHRPTVTNTAGETGTEIVGTVSA